MKLPKIIFVYHYTYDNILKGTKGFKLSELLKKSKEMEFYIKKVLDKWTKIETKILTEISKVTKLEWQETEIKCYLVGTYSSIPFSSPLTINKRQNIDEFIDTLIHELIHIILERKDYSLWSYWDYIYKKHKKENDNSVGHLIVHAVHKHILLKYFDKKRFEKEINSLKNLKSYRRSWEIVNKGGHENIIKEFTSKIK